MRNLSLRFLICFCGLFTLSGIVEAQYANSWIDFGKTYFKVPVASDGAYRLTFSDLQNSGFPVASIDPRRVQLFHRGVEQAIIVQGQADAKFDPGDYIEFYGRKNDGANDNKLYISPELQPHSYYNLYSDTAAYFLTWDQGLTQGKRMSNFSEINVMGIPKDTYHINERMIVYASEYSTGNTVSTVLQYTQFDEGEGWTGATICIGNSGCTGQLDNTINNIINTEPSGGNPSLELLLVGRDALSHMAEVYVGPSTGSLRLLSTENFINYQTRKVSLPILWTDISAGGQLVVRVKALGVGGIRDRLSISYIKVKHPQSFDMASQNVKWLGLQQNPSNKSYIELTNPASRLSIWDITDTNNIVNIGTNPTGPNLSAVIPNTATARKLFVKNTFTTPTIKKIGFRQIIPAAHDYIIITNKALMKPALGYADPVKAYGGYRASAMGGSYDTLLVTVDQLYNQFNHGESSAAAIYEFMKYLVENGDPKYLFLIGKGLNVSQGFFRKTVFGPNDLKDLVPSAGMPGSDMAFTAGLDGVPDVPAVPTGRITASTPTQVAAYLNKVIETEALGFNDLWRKDVLHLSGGIQPIELSTFKLYMDGFGDIARGPYYGGDIKTIGKQEANPVELINISEEVNNGVNFITFFGHSSPNTIDIDIGFATDPVLGYNNSVKYPAFLINGCNAGVVFSNGTVFGEDWVMAANKGARNFIAHSSFGFVNTLRAYTQLFYEIGFGDSTYIQSGIGDIQKEVARKYLEVNASSISSVTQVQQMLMLGDPAVKLFGAPKPDYETADNQLFLESFDDSPVTALTDSFAIKIITRNYGFVSKQPLKVKVTRTYNDQSVFSYDSLFDSPKSIDTLALLIRKEEGLSGFGSNQFLVELDYENDIDELNEDNNSAILSLFIPLSGTKNLLPRPFEIISSTNVTLKWQNTNLLSPLRSYEVELDTVDTFTSSYLQSFTVSGKALLSQQVALLSQDSLAYYWRTRLSDPQPEENAAWSTSSFNYIANGNEGWAQIHFPQFIENTTSGIVKDAEQRQLDFKETSIALFVNNFGANHPSPLTTSFKINDAEYNLATQGQPCRTNTINFVAFDKTTLVPYAGIPFVFQDPRTCGREPQVINSFALSELETGNNDDLIKYIDNINISDSVVIFSIADAGYPSWPSGAIAKLAELGISNSQIASLQAGEPVVILGKKGSTNGTAVIIKPTETPSNVQELQVSKSLTGKFTSGTMTSSLIGPADNWQSFTSFIRNKSSYDNHYFDLYGVSLSGEEEMLLGGVAGTADLSSIAASEFPFLKVVLHTSDEINQTPIQLHQWIVAYTPVAEGFLSYHGTTQSVFKQEGETWTAAYSFLNISDKSFSDSLLVNFKTFNKPLRVSETKAFNIKPPEPGDSTFFSVEVDTRHKTGLNDVNVFVNNRILPEQYYENNALELLSYLNVKKDQIFPLLDLTFDGRYIRDGDYVSKNPLIEARIWDESKNVLKVDTIGILIFLRAPCGTGNCGFDPIYFSRPDITWNAATETTDFKIDFSPELSLEGAYSIRIDIQDGSGNKLVDPYEIGFKVDHTNKVMFAEPYPNPFSDQIFIEFNVSGDVAPELMALQIFNLQGQLIRSYSNASLHIGANQFIWDGRDELGTLHNNGLYLYHLSVSAGGQTFSKHGKLFQFR